MSKTWETVFNLTSFMKYLLSEVLENEKVESPVYVVDSLEELMTVAGRILNKIKLDMSVSGFSQPTSSKPSCISVSDDIDLSNDDQLIPSAVCCVDMSENNTSKNETKVSKKFGNKENCDQYNSRNFLNDLGLQTLKIVPRKFVILSNEMLKGRHSGYYCKPCDVIVDSDDLWPKHLRPTHTSPNHNSEKQIFRCDRCNLVIFSTASDSKILLNHHKLGHWRIGSKQLNTALHANEVNRTNCSKSELGCDSIASNDGDNISSVFIEADTLSHSGDKKTIVFYCYFCDKAFYTLRSWNSHFKASSAQLLHKKGGGGVFEKCKKCKFEIFVTQSASLNCMEYHISGHPSNMNNRTSISIIEDARVDHLESSNHAIVDTFREFNSLVLEKKLRDCYYCCGCNTCLLAKKEWNQHCAGKIHQDKYLNCNSLEFCCSCCNLTILGTRAIAKHYLDYHQQSHVQSFLSHNDDKPEKSLNKNNLRKCTLSNVNNNDKMNPSMKRPYNSRKCTLSNVNNKDDMNSPMKKPRKLPGKKNISTTPDLKDNSKPLTTDEDGSPKDPNLISFFGDSKFENDQHPLFIRLMSTRFNEAPKVKDHHFGGYCFLCKVFLFDDSKWTNHLCKKDHVDKKKHAYFHKCYKPFNIRIYGNGDELKKYEEMCNIVFENVVD